MAYLLALDQGTTSSRTMVFDETGRVVALAQQEIRQIYPQPGWVEHDPVEIWDTQLATAKEAMSRAGITADDVVAMGITNQRETTLAWDRESGEPLHHALVWQDRRTAEQVEHLVQEGWADKLRDKTGLLPEAYFSATKMAWLLEQVPDLRRRVDAGQAMFGTVDSWLVYRLTQGRLHLTDATNASRTLLYNLHDRGWDPELLQLFQLPREALPEVRGSSEVYGRAEVEPLRGIPIAGIAGDQQAALFGQHCLRPGEVKNTYGTGCFMLRNVGDQPVPSRNRLLTTVAWELDGQMQYALEGSVFIGGAVVQWLRDGLGLIKNSGDIEALAASVPDNGGVYMVPAFAGLGAPHWDARARGHISGITRGTTAAHFARAALEAIAYQVADLSEAMEEDAGPPVGTLRVDGGAAANQLLMQFQADLLQRPLYRPHQAECTAWGAALLAGRAVGLWGDAGPEQGDDQGDRFEPAMSADQVQTLREGWQEAVERAKS